MDNKKLKVSQRLRLFVQIAFAALTNGYVLGYIEGKIYTGKLKSVCVPGLNCYSCPGAVGACPIGSLQAALNKPTGKFSFYVIGTLMIFGATMGRFVCGWLCPFGLVQDLLYKIPGVKKLRKMPGENILKYLRYVILVVFVILLPLFAVDAIGIGSPYFCKYICPSGTLLAGWPLATLNNGIRQAIGTLFAWKSFILVVIIVLSIIVYRPFCKFLCPLGALYGFFNPIALYRFSIDDKKCTRCKVCQKVCPIDIPVYDKPNSMDCIRCGKCKVSCPHGAIKTGK